MNLIIVDSEEQYKTLLKGWAAYKQDLDCGRAKLGDRKTIYYYKRLDDCGEWVWEIFNYGTYDHEICEGDLAGLVNSRAGNFPF